MVLLAMAGATIIFGGVAQATTYLPSIKIGTAALLKPLKADQFYTPFGTDSADGLSAYTHVATPTPPEIVELARALKYDPDLIYQYVHSNIQTVWMYGLQKGALGAEIDKSGTPFDQAELMVALLRQGTTPFTVNYIAGTIVLDESTAYKFSTWTGITNARAACQLLANGGFPASINGIFNVDCSAFAADATVSTVEMAHIWVQVSIGGTNYVFDPSYKTYTWKTGIPLATAMSFTSGQPLSAATTGGGYTSGTTGTPSVPYVNSLNATSLNTNLQNYTANLLTYIQGHSLQGAQLEDIVSGGVIQPTYTTLRQTSLPYVETNPPYTAHVWTPGASSARYNAIPNQYRTTLTVDGRTQQYDSGQQKFVEVVMFKDQSGNPAKLYADEIYGRRLTVETDFAQAGINSTWVNYFPQHACLALDAAPWGSWDPLNTPSWCLLSYSYEITDPTFYHIKPARDLPTHFILTVDHPYAASSGGGTFANGTYMDATLDKNVVLITPLTIVNGWGDVSAALFNKWSDERASDMALPILIHQPFCKEGEGETCPNNFQQPTGGFEREKMAANWLAQFSRAARLNAAIANAVPQIHHALGFVYGDATLQGVTAQGCPPPPIQCQPDLTIGDNFDRVDIDAGISLSSKVADATARRAAIEALATSSATLEGAMSGQLADSPDTASTATRFEWGNSPDPDHTTFSQNPFGIGPQDFYQYDGTNYGQASTLTKVDGGATGSCSGGGTDGWNAPPTLTPTQCYGSGPVLGLAGDFANNVAAYVLGGFSVVASKEAYLGPGQRGGMIIPIVVPGHPPTYYTHYLSKQRGGAFVALKRDTNGDPIEIAHIVVGLGDLLTKGGGSGSQPDDKTKYDPATAADILKSRFVDRSNLFGVNLANGSLSYTSPVSLKIGNGGFPYELSAGVSWHPGPPPDPFSLISPIVPTTGWVHSWESTVALSGSGLEAMGQSDIRAAAGAIAAFYATQDTYKQDVNNLTKPEREVTSVLIQSWWAHQLVGNVATVNVGGDARQFLKLPTTSQWILPGAGYATMVQTGSRVPYEEKCFHIFVDDAPYALNRGWNSSAVSFTVTNAQGDQQAFSYFVNPYHTADGRVCGNLKGFRLTSWTFPYGPSVTPTYSAVVDDGLGDLLDALTDVHNAFNRKLTFGTTSNTIGNNLTGADARSISFTQPVASASTIVNQLSKTTTYHYVGPFATSATQRPVPYQLINTVFTPNDATHANAEYDYDSLGRINQVKDATALNGSRPPYLFYLADGTRGERDDPLSQAYTVGYDTYGHPARYLDELAHKTDALFDSRGRAMQYTYPEGDCDIVAYDDHNNTTSYKRVDKVSLCDPNAGSAHVLTASAVYDQTWNKPTSVTNARGKTTTLDYYGTGSGSCATGNGTSLLCKATRPPITEGTPVYTFAYDTKGKLTDATGPTGIVTHNVYDANENLTSTVLDFGTGHLNLTTAFGYDPQGDVNSTTDPRGFVTTSLYELDRLKKEDDHHDGNGAATLNAASRTLYDDLRRDTEDDAGLTFSGGTVLTWQMVKQTGYTPTSKVASVTDADNQTTNTTYDDDDRVWYVTDPVSRKVRFVYCLPADANCAANQVKTEIRAWQGSNDNCFVINTLQECYRRVTYNANGEEASIQDADNNITTYAYDDFVRLTKTTFPDSISDYEQLTLDENGNVTQRRNRAGETLTYTYNALDWITQKCIPTTGASCPASPAVTDFWTYLLDGRIDTLCDVTACGTPGNILDYGYDGAGRLNQVATRMPGFGANKTVNYVLDANGNRTKLSWPSQDSAYYVGYCYDSLNRMTVAMENSTDVNCNTAKLATYTYNALSQRTNLAYGNAAAMGYSYSPAGDLLTLAHTIGGTANNPLYSFGYTAAHQLGTETISDGTYRWQPPGSGTDSYATANSLNQYPQFTPSGLSPRPLTYDGKGNLATGNINGDAVWKFAYDPENRLATACKPNPCTSPTVSATYTYDPLGRRIKKSGTGVTTTYFLSDGADEIAEYDSTKTVTVRYIPGPAIDEPIAMLTVSSGAKEYFHTNHQGSVIAMTDASGAKIEGPYTYDPCGNGAPSTGEPFKFTGRRLDPETGLYYYRARYYTSVLCRFLQTDPVGYTADLNLYTYVGNDPTDNGDPTGSCPPSAGGGCGAGYGDLEGCNASAGPCPMQKDQKTRQEAQMRRLQNSASIAGSLGAASMIGIGINGTQVAAANVTQVSATSSQNKGGLKGSNKFGEQFTPYNLLNAQARTVLADRQLLPDGSVIVFPPDGYKYAPISNGIIFYPPSNPFFLVNPANTIRIMFKSNDTRTAAPYLRIYNAQGQPISPYTGRTVSDALGHYPLEGMVSKSEGE